MTDEEFYKARLHGFITTLQGAFVEKVIFEEDKEPTFAKESLPFKFWYCHSITFHTDQGNYFLRPDMSSSGAETFWIEQGEPKGSNWLVKTINSQVKDISVNDGYDNLPCKLRIQFENSMLTLFAAEIYDTTNGAVDIKINDEMILVFDDSKDVEEFELMVNY